jgi:hypothetical protein
VIVEEADHGDGRPANERCESGEIVEGSFREGIEDAILLKRLEACLLVPGNRKTGSLQGFAPPSEPNARSLRARGSARSPQDTRPPGAVV